MQLVDSKVRKQVVQHGKVVEGRLLAQQKYSTPQSYFVIVSIHTDCFKWGIVAAALGGAGFYISPIYRGLTVQFKVYVFKYCSRY
jgi:hypothetical protein